MRASVSCAVYLVLAIACSSKSSQKLVKDDAGVAGSAGMGSNVGGGDSGGDAGTGGSTGDGGEAGAGAVVICDRPDDFEITALYFSNSIDAVIAADHSSLDFGPAGTIEAWILREDAAQAGYIFNKFGTAEDKLLMVDDASALVGSNFDGSTGVGAWTSSGAVPIGVWTHVAFVWNLANSAVYVDGITSGTQEVTADPADGQGEVRIGAVFRDDMQRWPIVGFVAEVRVSIAARYSSDFTPAPVLEADGVTSALWHFDEGSGLEAFDSSENGNDADIQGPTWQSAPCRPGMIEPE